MVEIREEDRQAAEKFVNSYFVDGRGPQVPELRTTLIGLVAQLRADAFTAGQVVGVERAANAAQSVPVDQFLFIGNPAQLARDVRFSIVSHLCCLIPDPDYIERVKRDVWKQAIKIVQSADFKTDNEMLLRTAIEMKMEVAAALRSQQTKQ